MKFCTVALNCDVTTSLQYEPSLSLFAKLYKCCSLNVLPLDSTGGSASKPHPNFPTSGHSTFIAPPQQFDLPTPTKMAPALFRGSIYVAIKVLTVPPRRTSSSAQPCLAPSERQSDLQPFQLWIGPVVTEACNGRSSRAECIVRVKLHCHGHCYC